jgi:hypothetical protein
MPQGNPPPETAGRITGRPGAEQIPDANNPRGAEGSVSLVMHRISAIAITAEAYSKQIAAMVLSTLALGLLFVMVIIHRIANRILTSL